MPDTHDADPYDWDPVYAATTIDGLQKQLAAMTARAEKAEQERDVWKSEAERRSAERNAAVRRIGQLRVWLDELGYDALSVDRRLRGDAEAADAAPDGRSATETAGEGVRESVDEDTSSILPRGLSEPEGGHATATWCWAPNPNGPLRCGRLRNHDGPHQRGERTWTNDDITEGR